MATTRRAFVHYMLATPLAGLANRLWRDAPVGQSYLLNEFLFQGSEPPLPLLHLPGRCADASRENVPSATILKRHVLMAIHRGTQLDPQPFTVPYDVVHDGRVRLLQANAALLLIAPVRLVKPEDAFAPGQPGHSLSSSTAHQCSP